MLASFFAGAAAYSPSSRPAIHSRIGSARSPSINACPVATSTSTADAAKLFGRLAEAQLYLDPTIGACCHSACSDCEWRDPEGGYRCAMLDLYPARRTPPRAHEHLLSYLRSSVDLLKSTQPKWVPCYRERDFADERGSHATRCSLARA